MQAEISIAARILTEVERVSSIIEQLFPDNDHELTEAGTVFSSAGDVFECAVEPRNNRPVRQVYLSGTYRGDTASYNAFLSGLVDAFNKNSIVYSIDSEFKEGDEYVEKTVFHPDFDKVNTPS